MTKVTVKTLPAKNATVNECKEALKKIETEFSLLDTRMGYVGWLKGKTLKIAKDACNRESKKFPEFCEEIGIKRSTAYLFISIAEKYSAKQVEKKTLTELRDGIRETTGPGKKKPVIRNVQTVRTKNQTLATVTGDLDTTLKVLQSAMDMDLGNSQDEAADPERIYRDSIQVLRHIQQRTNECISEFESRINNLRKTNEIAAESGITLNSREAA